VSDLDAPLVCCQRRAASCSPRTCCQPPSREPRSHTIVRCSALCSAPRGGVPQVHLQGELRVVLLCRGQPHRWQRHTPYKQGLRRGLQGAPEPGQSQAAQALQPARDGQAPEGPRLGVGGALRDLISSETYPRCPCAAASLPATARYLRRLSCCLCTVSRAHAPQSIPLRASACSPARLSAAAGGPSPFLLRGLL
jgi:hypothetical protein